jgi:hypothetical protein
MGAVKFTKAKTKIKNKTNGKRADLSAVATSIGRKVTQHDAVYPRRLSGNS